MDHGTFKNAIVIRSVHLDELIVRRTIGGSLQQFLKLTFGVVQTGQYFQLAEMIGETLKDKLSGGLKTRIQINRSNQSFESICKGAEPLK